MKFRKEPVQSCYLLDTGVENIFIHEYMVSAPGDFVKIYLVALMYTEMGEDIDQAGIAKMLSIPEEEVEKAWVYWEGMGVVRKKDDTIEFAVLKECLYGKKPVKEHETPVVKPSAVLENKSLKGMYKSIERTIGRMLTGSETTEMINWMDDFGATPELIAYAYAYCMTKKKDNVRYVGAVVKGWTSNGLTNVTEIEKYLSDNDQRHYSYKRIMQALGFTRNATEEEKRLINAWFDGLNCDMEDILNACGKTSGIPNPNINYVNKILNNQHAGGDAAQNPAVMVGRCPDLIIHNDERIIVLGTEQGGRSKSTAERHPFDAWYGEEDGGQDAFHAVIQWTPKTGRQIDGTSLDNPAD